jgi:hypothetical protein
MTKWRRIWGFTLSMVKQLWSTWIQVKTYLKCAWYHYVWTDVHIWKDFNKIGDKQRSKVENLAKYVHLQEVGRFQIIISVTKYQLFYTKAVIIYRNKYQLCFYKKYLGKKANVGPLLFIWICKSQIDIWLEYCMLIFLWNISARHFTLTNDHPQKYHLWTI